MDIRFSPHNLHIENPAVFLKHDPNLRQLARQSLVYHSPLLNRIPRKTPGIYTITGGRQIGKTTLLKQWMACLLEDQVKPGVIVYFTGELIDDHHSLIRLIMDWLNKKPDRDISYILLDEVTYVNNWDKGIKYLADAGFIEKTVMIITGSDTAVIKEARMRFPGRRGVSSVVDFHLYPLSFFESVSLNKQILPDEIDMLTSPAAKDNADLLDCLYKEFDMYLVHGGFLTAMNDISTHQAIQPATFSIYSDWIRGDVLKRGKHEHYLIEILQAIVKRYGSQITWNAMAHDLSIDHPKTVADYVALLVSMDAVFVQAALLENKLTASPKKARKVMFADPFIFHAVNAWLNPCKDPFNEQIKPLLCDSLWSAKLVEACVITHYRRSFPTYYIKSKGEVDIAYVDKKRFWPVEIKWTGQLHSKNLKQITKYPNGLILTKLKQKREIQGIPAIPLPLALLQL